MADGSSGEVKLTPTQKAQIKKMQKENKEENDLLEDLLSTKPKKTKKATAKKTHGAKAKGPRSLTAKQIAKLQADAQRQLDEALGIPKNKAKAKPKKTTAKKSTKAKAKKTTGKGKRLTHHEVTVKIQDEYGAAPKKKAKAKKVTAKKSTKAKAKKTTAKKSTKAKAKKTTAKKTTAKRSTKGKAKAHSRATFVTHTELNQKLKPIHTDITQIKKTQTADGHRLVHLEDGFDRVVNIFRHHQGLKEVPTTRGKKIKDVVPAPSKFKW